MSHTPSAGRRWTSLAVATAWGVGLLTVQSAAVGAAESCQGQPATIVGSPGKKYLTGTKGADVIVSNGSASIDSRGGDDLICLTSATGRRDSVRVYAGDGDDVVINLRTRRGAKAQTRLGLGDDVYRGSRGRDVIRGEFYDQTADDGIDDIRTGPGADRVDTGVVGVPNSDHVDLGAGRDWLTVIASDSSAATLEGGRGGDLLRGSGLGGAAWVLDNRSHTATSGGVLKFGWSSFEEFGLNGFSSLTHFLGGPQGETLTTGDRQPVEADMGGGDDRLVATVSDLAPTIPADWRFTGGDGRDSFLLSTDSRRSFTVDVDARRQRVAVDGPGVGHDVTVPLPGFEDFSAAADVVRITGSSNGERLSANGCDVRIDGRGGDDRLSSARVGNHAWCRRSRPARLRGGSGDDRLSGSGSRDVLVGGPGRDVAHGRGGRDTCDAEVERSCERS